MRLLRACLVTIFENCSKKQEEQRKYGEYGLVTIFYCFEKHKEYIKNLIQRTKQFLENIKMMFFVFQILFSRKVFKRGNNKNSLSFYFFFHYKNWDLIY